LQETLIVTNKCHGLSFAVPFNNLWNQCVLWRCQRILPFAMWESQNDGPNQRCLGFNIEILSHFWVYNVDCELWKNMGNILEQPREQLRSQPHAATKLCGDQTVWNRWGSLTWINPVSNSRNWAGVHLSASKNQMTRDWPNFHGTTLRFLMLTAD
jgi:hypothetical protein